MAQAAFMEELRFDAGLSRRPWSVEWLGNIRASVPKNRALRNAVQTLGKRVSIAA
jgi:hypothetical protein